MELDNLKKDYDVLARKHSLPGFKEINEAFEIEKIERDSEVLLQLVRKVCMDKALHFLNFLEMIQNPVNAPRMYHTYLKSMSEEDKKKVDEIYMALGDLSLRSLKLEFSYNEVEEAKFLKALYSLWKSMDGDITEIIDGMMSGKTQSKKEKSYFS
jgi:hypothetical protein